MNFHTQLAYAYCIFNLGSSNSQHTQMSWCLVLFPMEIYTLGEVSILIATDVASRGLDIQDIT